MIGTRRAVLLAVVLLSVVGCGDPGAQALQEADRLFAQGHLEEAARAYTSMPPEAAAWQPYGAWRAAVIYEEGLRDPQRAEEAYERCVADYGESDWGYSCRWKLADLRLSLGRPREAIDAYRAALELRARGEMAEHCLLQSGRAYLQLGDPAQARVEWKELLQAFPRSPLAPTVALETGLSYDLEGRYADALKAFQLMQRRYPAHALHHRAGMGEAAALEQLGRLDEAEQRYESLLDEYPNPEAVQIRLRSLRARRDRMGATAPYKQGDSGKRRDAEAGGAPPR